MNQEIYDRSEEILASLGYNLADDSILDMMTLPPLEEWEADKKLRLFVPVIKKLSQQDVPLLERAIKNSRSAAKASINGKILEDAVQDLASRYGLKTLRNVSKPDVAEESIDVVIIFPDGKEIYIMCQMDLWGGGQQTNRAEKYLNRDDVKFISVVYNSYTPLNQKTQKNIKAQNVQRWITTAHTKKRLMWLADLDSFLREQNA